MFLVAIMPSSSDAFHHVYPIIKSSSSKLCALERRRDLLFEGTGSPSKPGWKNSRISRLTEWAGSKESNRPIIGEYDPNGWWLWRKWQGTVLKMTKGSIIRLMGMGLLLDILARKHGKLAGSTWSLLEVPLKTSMIQSLTGIRKMWQYHLTLATFILTFFLSQAYGYWQKVYNTCRMIQGRINDICLLLTVGAKRMPRNDETGKDGYNDEAELLLRRCARLLRISHIFFWAATPTASNGLTDCEEFLEDGAVPPPEDGVAPLLLNSSGLKALVASGQLSAAEAEDLMTSSLPPSQYAFMTLVWIGIHVMDGLEKGLFRGGQGWEENILRQLTTLRACMFDIDDFRAGRMPLAYVHLVQVMVDSLVFLAPFALYPELGSMAIPLVGLMTLFFRGLLALSKSFLDPFGVEGFGEQDIRVDVLVSELNFGAAKRWIQGGKTLPEGLSKINFSPSV